MLLAWYCAIHTYGAPTDLAHPAADHPPSILLHAHPTALEPAGPDLKGEFTDLTLRVKLKTDIDAAAADAAAADAAAKGKGKGNAAKAPAAKKRRTASSSAAAAAAPAAAAEEEAGAAPAVAVTEIRCHAAVLAARSAYFRSCLTG